ncbi:MAG TPA: LL-diaminopimelate aminotransferase [bacterium]|nr:LL-diaminopimelate aminotransferase [bacterium]
MSTRFERAERVRELPPYLFAEIDKKKQAVAARGVDIISFGIGDPDLPTPAHIVRALKHAAEKPANHQYPSYEGMPAFREATAQWYQTRFGVTLDPKTEIVSLIGSKEGIAHMPLVYVNPGDVVLVPAPGYPVYGIGTLFANGQSYLMPLTAENGFLPDYDAIPPAVARKAKLLWINYPNNPTAAVAPDDFFHRTIEFARKYDVIVCHDAAYTEVSYDGYRCPSFLQYKKAREVGLEFHSLSKTYNMTGWRIGFAAGNAEAIAGLGCIKTNIDSGVFQAVQEAGITALTGKQDCVAENNAILQRRRDLLAAGLRELGWQVPVPKATFYLWLPTPGGLPSTEVAGRLLDEAGIVVTPGIGFGRHGEGYIRMTITVPEERIKIALERMRKVRW